VSTLSLIVITKNEEHAIEKCLRSVDFASERIVVDSGSTDRTVEIARANGAHVVTTKDWPGFGAQKNRALDLAQSDWVLSLDADEWIEPDFSAAIRRAIEAPDAPDAYEMVRRSRFCGQLVRHGGWSSDRVIRLFKRGRGRFSDHMVHESVVVDGPVQRLDVTIDHDSIESWQDALDKIERYSTAAALQMAARGRRASSISAPLHGWAAFVKVYLMRGGFLDGATGWRVAEYNRRYAAAKYQRLAEYSRKPVPRGPV
jgi:glycosyltransferase involved in cell wall biosynthesis